MKFLIAITSVDLLALPGQIVVRGDMYDSAGATINGYGQVAISDLKVTEQLVAAVVEGLSASWSAYPVLPTDEFFVTGQQYVDFDGPLVRGLVRAP